MEPDNHTHLPEEPSFVADRKAVAGRYDLILRPRRDRYRLYLGAVLLVAAAATTVWLVWGAIACHASGPAAAQEVRQIEPDRYVRLGSRSVLAMVLCAGVLLCATRPIRRGRSDYARLAAVEVAATGLLLAAVVLTYWLAWCPLTFLK